jgi:sugar lactone lactonase YvrE
MKTPKFGLGRYHFLVSVLVGMVVLATGWTALPVLTPSYGDSTSLLSADSTGMPSTIAGGTISGDTVWQGEVLADEEARTLYADGANPEGGDGTAANPYQTIGQALEAALAGDTILVAQGTYTESMILYKDIDLYGGYASYTSPSPWTRDITLYETIVDGNQNGSVITFQPDGEGAVLDGFTITGGYASEAGGGITIAIVSPEIRSCTIRQNTAHAENEWCGGGILISEGASPVISNTIISGNSVSGGASGVRIGNASVTMINSLVAGNSGSPAIHANNASLTLTNVTIADHSTDGGILLNSSQAAIVNTIIWENTGPDINAINDSGYTIEYSDVEDDVLPGMGNISGDPLFVGDGNYHLQSGSPAIDTGNTEAAPGQDLEGNLRPQDGDGNGTPIADMGAYEYVYQEPPPIVYFTDASTPSGRVYRLENGTETIYHTRGNGYIYNLAFSPDGTLYYSDANDNDLYRLENGSEALVYHHSTYLCDVAFDSTGQIYISEASGSTSDGHIYHLDEEGTVSEYYTVSLADVGVWGGDFAFDGNDNLYLSTGRVAGARIYQVVEGTPQAIFSAPEDEAIAGICFDSDGNLYYASWLGGNIYKVNTGTGERSLFYSNPEHSLLSDVFIPSQPPVTLADLVITDVWSENDEICYQIGNTGKATAPGGHYTALAIDGEPVTEDVVATDIAPGERLKRCFDYHWVCTAGVTILVTADAGNNVTESDDANNSREEAWKCDLTPPLITSGPAVSEITTSSAVISWTTDEASDSVVIYSTTRSLLDAWQETETTQTTQHFLTLQNLAPSTTYCFKVESSDPAGNIVTSPPQTFETQPAPDETNPTVSLADPGQCTGDALISASASDDTGVAKVEFYLNDKLVFTDYSPPYELPLNTTIYENGNYNLVSKVFDLAGRSADDQHQIEIANIKDLTVPVVTITSHQDDETVSGTINITADISDDTGIDSVRFYVDGDYIEYSPCFPPVPKVILGETFVWNTKWVSDGLHSVAVEAKDIDSKLGAQNVRLNVVNQPAPPPPTPYLTIKDNSVSRTQNCFTITLKVKNEGDAEASNVNIKYGLKGFQSIDASSTQADFAVDYYVAGKFDICDITPKQNIPAGATRTYTFNAVPVLLYPNPPAPEPGFFIDMYWQSPSGGKYSDYITMPAAKTTGGETMAQAYNNALKACDYLMVTNPWLVYVHNSKADLSDLLSTMAQLAWDEQGVLGYFFSGTSGALTNLTKVGGAWSNKLKSGWTSNGYLLIVGETDIMPAWSYSDGTVETTTDPNYPLQTTLTDLPYANTTGSILSPELSIGRIIGNSASELKKVIQTSLYIYEGVGGCMFDRSDFFSVSGYPKCISGGCGNIDFKKEALADALAMRDKGIDGIAMFTPDYSQYDASGQINYLLTKNLIRQKFFGNTPNKDVIFLAGHGNAGSWDVITVNDILNPGIIMPFGVTSPFVFASSCLTGRYYGGTCPAEAFLQRGAAVYLGAVEPGLVPPHDSISKRFFQKWDAGESIGLAVKQTKQSNSGQCEDFWSVIYNLYGDPKFGSPGPPGDVATPSSFIAQEEPPSSVDVVIPDYQVEQIEGQDYVEIPGGGILSVPGKPLVPYYRVFYDYPQGYQIQDVVLASRSEPITATGLNIPNSLIELPGQKVSAQLERSSSPEWWPEKDFEWAVQENPDGVTLAITIYPFFYNPLTTDFRFHINYSFNIAYTASNIQIAKLEIDKPSYHLNKVTGYIEFSDGEEGEIPPEGDDILIDVAFRKQGSDEVFHGLPVRTLRNFRGRASYSFEWGDIEAMPAICDVEVTLRDTTGNLLDKKIDMVEPGTPSLDIVEFNVSPQQCNIGDSINVVVQLENTGLSDIPLGAAVIQVKDQAGNTVTEFLHEFTDLVPGGTLSFNSTWDTSAAEKGAYNILGYVVYGNTISSPQIAAVTVGVVPIPGDANEDGVVDALDLQVEKQIILGELPPTDGADANQDGNINTLDLVKIKRIILGLD